MVWFESLSEPRTRHLVEESSDKIVSKLTAIYQILILRKD